MSVPPLEAIKRIEQRLCLPILHALKLGELFDISVPKNAEGIVTESKIIGVEAINGECNLSKRKILSLNTSASYAQMLAVAALVLELLHCEQHKSLSMHRLCDS